MYPVACSLGRTITNVDIGTKSQVCFKLALLMVPIGRREDPLPFKWVNLFRIFIPVLPLFFFWMREGEGGGVRKEFDFKMVDVFFCSFLQCSPAVF